MKKFLAFLTLLVATSAYGQLSFSPSSLSFGSETVNTFTPYQKLVVSNPGGSTVYINLSVTGSNPSDFTQTNTCPFIKAGETCQIWVLFNPTAAGSRTASISLIDTSPGSPHTASLSGTGTAVNNTRYLSGTLSSDTGSCTNPALPCATFAYVCTQAVAGDLVDVLGRNGRYKFTSPLDLMACNQGVAGQPINFQGDPTDIANNLTPTITGMFTVTPGSFSAVGAPVGSCNNTSGQTPYVYPLTGFNNFEAFFYAPVSVPATRVKRSSRNFRNGATPTANVCVAGGGGNPFDATADANCGVTPDYQAFCAANPTVCNGHVANLQTSPVGSCSNPAQPYQCMNKCLTVHGDVSPSLHGMGLGDLENVGMELWVNNRLRIQSVNTTSVSCPTASLPSRTCDTIEFMGPAQLSSGNSGCIAGHNYEIQGTRENLSAGTWALDRCPGNSASCNLTAGGGPGTPEATWNLLYCAKAGENPASDTSFFPQTSQLIISSNTGTTLGPQYIEFQGINMQGDNWLPGPFELGDSQGTPKIVAAIELRNANGIVFDQVGLSHIQGKGIEFLGYSNDNAELHSIMSDTGAGPLFIGAISVSGDTDLNTPHRNFVFDNKHGHTGRTQATGEATGGAYVGDASGTVVSHNEFIGNYTGCVNLGHGLNRDATGGTSAFFMYDNWDIWNRCQGEGASGVFDGILLDYGAHYAASNYSPLCPALPPSLSPTNTYCSHRLFNWNSDYASNYNDTSHRGATCNYNDQGTTAMEDRFNLCVRFPFEENNQNFPSRTLAYLSTYNLEENEIFALSGACEYGPIGNCPNPLQGFTNPNNRVINNGGLQPNAFTFRHNIVFINSLMGTTIQSDPGHNTTYNQAGVLVDPATNWVFSNNIVFDVAGNPLKYFLCANAACSGNGTQFFAPPYPWGRTGVKTEDVGSLNIDPHFVCPLFQGCGAAPENWTPTASVRALIGFEIWPYTQAGTVSNTFNVPATPNLFPITPIDSTTDYITGFTTTQVNTITGGTIQ